MKLNIGNNIRTLRRAADMTQEELADRLGVTYQSVSRWENGGTYPDMELLPAIADIFGVTVDHLLKNGQEDVNTSEAVEGTEGTEDAAKEASDADAAGSEEYADIGIAVVTDYVNVRSEPSAESEAVGKLYANNALQVVGKNDILNILLGFLFSSFLNA